MKELISSMPLMLFLFLLLTLSISIYFGNVKVSENLDIMNPKDQLQLVDDLKTIIDYVRTPKTPGNEHYVSEDDWFNQWDNIENSNYISKTQIVPLNCSQCQNSKGGVCTVCGGLGGKGTSSNYKNRFADFLTTYGSGYRGNGEWAGIGGGCAGKDNDNPSLSRLAEKAGSGAVNLLRDTGSGAVDLLKDTGSGAVGLVRDAGSEVSELLRPNPVQLSRNGGYASGGSGAGGVASGGSGAGGVAGGAQSVQNQGSMIDPYSYNGALVSKGGNFIPITNDFSAFRK